MDPYNNPLSSMDFSTVNPASYSANQNQFDPVPKGTYNVAVTTCEVRDYNGQYFISLRYKVLDGQFHGRILSVSIWGMWDDDNHIAMETWAALRAACGLDPRIGGDYPDVIGKMLQVDVDTYFKRNGKEANKITAYKQLPPQAAVPPKPQGMQPAQPAPQPQYQQQQYQQAQPQYQQPVQPQGGIDEVPF